ncbi:hypothetical protein [Acidithiobacillus albertensis]|uniref:hypothetical protein n=1 Tax=Acidithiobacillus albertensis TaxID=119978 RepID=UPI00094B026B|nr:hypothetical protein [Acidithiobacillus albertensis]
MPVKSGVTAPGLKPNDRQGLPPDTNPNYFQRCLTKKENLVNRKMILIYVTMIASMGLAGCANNPYASNGTTADVTGGAVSDGVGNASNNAYTRSGHHYQMEMTSFVCPEGYICRPTHPSHPNPTTLPPPVKKRVNKPVIQQYVPHFPFCPHGKVCQYHQQDYVTQHGKTVFVVNTPPPPGSQT